MQSGMRRWVGARSLRLSIFPPLYGRSSTLNEAVTHLILSLFPSCPLPPPSIITTCLIHLPPQKRQEQHVSTHLT